MNLDELLGSVVLESDPKKLFHYYAHIDALIDILRSGHIRSGSTYSNLDRKERDQISVIIPSGPKDLEFIVDEEGFKKIVACFDIQFDVVNDKIHKLKYSPINELALSFEKDIERILSEYKAIEKKDEIISHVEKYKSMFSPFDYRKLHNKIFNYLLNLNEKEEEERIFTGKIKIDPLYTKINLLPKCLEKYESSNIKNKRMFESMFLDNVDYFVDNDTLKKFKIKFDL